MESMIFNLTKCSPTCVAFTLPQSTYNFIVAVSIFINSSFISLSTTNKLKSPYGVGMANSLISVDGFSKLSLISMSSREIEKGRRDEKSGCSATATRGLLILR